MIHRQGMWAWVCVAMAGLAPVACDRSSSGTDTGDDSSGKKRIGVTLLTEQDRFYQDLRAGLESEAAKHGYELFFSSAERNSTRQSNQIDEFIVQRLDAIVVCPADSGSVGTSIREANDAGIPVFTADIACTSPMGKVVSHIASDNKQGGRLAARLLAKAINGTGKTVILSHPEVASVQERVSGFKVEMSKHSGVVIVDELSSDGVRDKATKVMEDLLQSHPDLAGVFAINDDSALGALAAIEAAGKLGQIKIVGYDATPEAREKIKAGDIYGDVIQHPKKIGELTIQAIHDYFSGKEPPAVIPVEVGTFTKDSA